MTMGLLKNLSTKKQLQMRGRYIIKCSCRLHYSLHTSQGLTAVTIYDYEAGEYIYTVTPTDSVRSIAISMAQRTPQS